MGYGLNNFMDCMNGLKKVIELDPKNKEARALYMQAQAGQKEEDKKSKGLFAKMCAGLGKGPIPPPGQDKSKVSEEDDDDDDEAMEDTATSKDNTTASKDDKDAPGDVEMKPTEETATA